LEAERRGEKPQRGAQDAAETRHGARDDPSPAPGPKNARAPDSEQFAKVIELSERIGS
jgi:hypothetical protein